MDTAEEQQDGEKSTVAVEREPTDGESYGPNGNIRPVPPHVPHYPEEDDMEGQR